MTTPATPRDFRKKPVVIQAMQFHRGPDHDPDMEAIWEFCPKAAWVGVREFADLVIPTMEGEMRCSDGDWIIRGVKGEFYPCKPDIFEATYEPVLARPQGAPQPPAVEQGDDLCEECGNPRRSRALSQSKRPMTDNEANLVNACLRVFLSDPVDFFGFNLVELSNRISAERAASRTSEEGK